MITLWGRRNSGNVQKVLWALEELGVRYTREPVGGSFGGNKDADFLAMNPMGLVPVIRDGDVTMFESNAIVRYLAARFGEGSLRPSGHHALAMAEQWMEWQHNTFAPPVTTIFFNTIRLPPEKRNAGAVSDAEARAADALKVADAHLARNEWFAGNQFSFGDIVMGSFYYRFLGLACTKPDVPHVAAWMDAVTARDAFRNTIGAVPRAKDPEDWLKIEREFG